MYAALIIAPHGWQSPCGGETSGDHRGRQCPAGLSETRRNSHAELPVAGQARLRGLCESRRGPARGDCPEARHACWLAAELVDVPARAGNVAPMSDDTDLVGHAPAQGSLFGPGEDRLQAPVQRYVPDVETVR